MHKNLSIEEAEWRSSPGILSESPSSAQSIHALLGYFLKDRTSPTLFPGRDSIADNVGFEWGMAPPLEKVISGDAELELLFSLPELYCKSMSIVEPWEHVGVNLENEAVRASKNTAYLLQQVADADSILYPVWQSGIRNPVQLATILSAGLATIFQGGNPSVYDADSFSESAASLDEILRLVDNLLISRSSGSGPSIFICLGHQLAAASHIRLIKRAAQQIIDTDSLPMDLSGHTLNALKSVAEEIIETGESLTIMKAGEEVARGWSDPKFAVAKNESIEIGSRNLLQYERREGSDHVPAKLHDAHALIADEHEGVIDTMLKMERAVSIEMFHSDEVNEEAILFASWAYRMLHNCIVPIRYELAVSSLSWLLQLPYALEILAQTQVNEKYFTEVSTTAIYYKDWETSTIRRSFTCQFHPELMADIRGIGQRTGITYPELKDNDGVRLFIRLLYHGLQE